MRKRRVEPLGVTPSPVRSHGWPNRGGGVARLRGDAGPVIFDDAPETADSHRVLTGRKSRASVPAPAALSGGAGVEQYELTTVASLAAGGGVIVDRANRVIRNIAFMTTGPAMGHGFVIDEETLDTYVAAFNANAEAMVCRLSHPELDWTGGKDGIEYLVAVPFNCRREGSQVRGDVRILKVTKHSPTGSDVGEYVLGLAEEVPGRIGVSVVAGFRFDETVDATTGRVLERRARTVWTKAVDFVGDPAANRNGLLSSNNAPSPHSGGGGSGNHAMDRIRQYLLALGLIQASATDAELKAALKKLNRKQKRVVATLRNEDLNDDERAEELRELGVNPDKPHEALATPAAPATGTEQPAAAATLSTAAGAGQQAAAPAAAAPAAPSAPATALTTEVSRLVAEQLHIESQRVSQIRGLAAAHNMGDAWALGHIEARRTLDQVREDVLTQLAQRRGPIAGLGNGGVTAGSDPREAMAQAVEDYLTTRFGIPCYEVVENLPQQGRPVVLRRGEGGQFVTRQPHELARRFENRSIIQVGEAFLGALGVNTAGMTPESIAMVLTDKLLLAQQGVGGVALAHTSSDFPLIFANVLNKQLLPAYTEEASTWEAIGQEYELRDFREHKLVQMGMVPTPPRVLEGEEYTYVTLGEKGDGIQGFKYGYLLAWTWEMMVNDDLQAFVQSAFGFAQACKALENDLFWGQVTGNPTVAEDGVALFHADHNNLNQGSAGALSIDKLDAMRGATATQKGISPKPGTPGRTITLRLNRLVVPTALESKAEQLVASLVKPGGSNNEPNYRFIRNLTVVSESRLDASSTTRYYTAVASNRACPAGYVAKLRGYKSPTVERINTGSSVDGVTVKCRHVTGAKITDYRGWQRNDGA